MYKSTLVCPECNFTCVKFDTMVRAPPTLQCLQQVPVHDFVRLWDRSGQDHDRLQLWGCATSSCNRRRSSAWQLWGATEAQAAQHGPRFQPWQCCAPRAQTSVSLELPRTRTRSAEFVVVQADGSAAPRKHALEVPSDGTVADIYAKLAQVPCEPSARSWRRSRCGACSPLRAKMYAGSL